tara:strand:+ start:225 stop:416 length:192 start_codon:yes stop_codon:yes gene_type:complete
MNNSDWYKGQEVLIEQIKQELIQIVEENNDVKMDILKLVKSLTPIKKTQSEGVQYRDGIKMFI